MSGNGVSYRLDGQVGVITGSANGIGRALAVGPTFVSTPMTTSMFTDPAFIAENLPKIPSGRFGTTDDVVGAVRFLLSPAADLINGHLLLVDGGYTCW